MDARNERLDKQSLLYSELKAWEGVRRLSRIEVGLEKVPQEPRESELQAAGCRYCMRMRRSEPYFWRSM